MSATGDGGKSIQVGASVQTPHAPKFAICVGRGTTGFRPAWPSVPDCRWQGASARVSAWLWGVPGATGETGPLQFTIGNGAFRRDAYGAAAGDAERDLNAIPHVTVRLNADGQGEVAQDPLGLHPLYEARHRRRTFISNCLHLTAAMLAASTGTPVRKSLAMSAWLATGDRPIGRMTGYEGVFCTPYAAHLAIHPKRGVSYVHQTLPWAVEADPFEGVSADDLIDQAVAEMVRGLKRHVAGAAGRPLLPLSGGYDSRLVLALAAEADVLGDVDVVTYGDADDQDVTLASELAKRLRLRHRVKPPKYASGDGRTGERHVTVATDLKDLVGSRAGMLSLRLDNERVAGGPVILHGLLGEALRANVRTERPIRTRQELLACWLQPLAYSGLVRRDPQVSASVEGAARLLAPLEHGVAPSLALDVFYLAHLIRRWVSARPDFFWTTAFPLYCMSAIRLALRLGWAARKNAFFHETVIARQGDAFTTVPYAPGKEPRRVPSPTDLGIDAARTKRLKPKSLVRSWVDNVIVHRRPCQRTAHAPPPEHLQDALTRRQGQYREFAAGTERCSIWDALDREKVDEAISLYPQLDGRARQDLDAAMAGVIWHGV